ncbi:MAG: glycosyltransferase family 4 protein, partial [Desulfonatronovibrionaceae bacterium]
REHGIEKNVEFMGYREDVPNILPFANLIVMPSEYEGFGIAFLEAMHCGVPGILSKDTPIIEIAKECSLVTDTTPEDISQKIIKFLTDEKFYNQCSQKAREIAAQHTVENYVPNLLEIYNKYI